MCSTSCSSSSSSSSSTSRSSSSSVMDVSCMCVLQRFLANGVSSETERGEGRGGRMRERDDMCVIEASSHLSKRCGSEKGTN